MQHQRQPRISNRAIHENKQKVQGPPCRPPPTPNRINKPKTRPNVKSKRNN